MTPPPVVASLERDQTLSELDEKMMATAQIDGDHHSLIWIHNSQRTISVLVDRPDEGDDTVRVIGVFTADEGEEVVKTVIADYRDHHVEIPRAERTNPRPLEPGDLEADRLEGGGPHG